MRTNMTFGAVMLTVLLCVTCLANGASGLAMLCALVGSFSVYQMLVEDEEMEQEVREIERHLDR